VVEWKGMWGGGGGGGVGGGGGGGGGGGEGGEGSFQRSVFSIVQQNPLLDSDS